MIRTSLVAIAITILVAQASLALGTLEVETDGTAINNNTTSAQILPDSFFTVDPNPRIFKAFEAGLAGTAVTATVAGRTGPSLDVDFYQFNMLKDGYAWFDIDCPTSASPDWELQLFNAFGTLMAYGSYSVFDLQADNIPEEDPGSFTSWDPFIGEIFLRQGTYNIAVSRGLNHANGGTGIFTPQVSSFYPAFATPTWFFVSNAMVGNDSFFLGNGPQSFELNYVLHISQIVPEPSAIVLWMVSLVSLAVCRTRF